MANRNKYLPILARTGVDKDNTNLQTQHYTDASRIRFYNGLPRKLGGNLALNIDNDNTVEGCIRSIYSQKIGGKIYTMIGTHTRLYALVGTELTNITPLVTSTTAIANSIDTYYQTLGSNPAATTSGSANVVITSTAHVLRVGDIVTLSGFSGALNNIPDTELNSDHIVRAATTNTYTITVSTAANATGSGGGASVVEALPRLLINHTAHGFANGDRIKLAAATATGGIGASEINAEHIILNVATNSYDIIVTTTATSSVTGGGGASTTVQGQIASGNCDGGAGIGYGMGRYGAGLYGASKTSSNNITVPRIWQFDRYGNNVIMTAGDQTGLYSWDGTTTVAPTLLTNAPTAINYVFESNNIIVTFGDSDVDNRIKWSDQGASTVWTSTNINQAGDDDIEGADKFISHATARNGELLFTAGRKIVLMQYIGRPLVWSFTTIEAPDALIAPNARVSVNGIVYIMGNNNLWEYNGGVIRPLQSNSDTGHNYLRRYIFNDINTAQKSKCFCWYNPIWDEVWFHYPSSGSTEPDRVVRWSRSERHLTPDENYSRSAAESPVINNVYPRLAGVTGDNKIYKQEQGVTDNGSALDWSLTFPSLQVGSDLVDIGEMIPDSTQTGDIGVVIEGKAYPQSSSSIYSGNTGTVSATSSSYTVSPTTERLSLNLQARTVDITISQTGETNGDWIMGRWNIGLTRGSERL